MMKDDIGELFDDLDFFSRLIAKVQLSNYSFEVYNFKKYEMVVEVIFARTNQFENVQEAFSAIFKKELFDGEEWDVNDEPNASDEQWIQALKNTWIYDYYLKYVGVSLELIDNIDFISRFKSDLYEVNAPETNIGELLMRFNNLEVVQVSKGNLYTKIFGQSESYYFLFEFGIYD